VSFKSMLKQSITVENPDGSRDKQGRDGLGSSTTLAARVQRTNKVITTAERDREPIDAIIFVGPETPVRKSARITYDSEQYRVIKSEDVPGRNGSIHHIEIMAQLWSYKAGS